jgi:group I intron endonuclease
MEKMLVVYRITFDGTDKCYIGISNNLEIRRKKHLQNAKIGVKGKLYNAIRKYGNPKFEILEVCETKEVLLEKESEYINKFDSFKNGLNSTLGGEGSFGSSREKTSTWKQRQSQRMKGEKNPMFGISFSEERKQQHSQRMKDFYRDNPNRKAFANKSSFGLIWINNGSVEKKVKKTEVLPYGFIKGRIFRQRNKRRKV